MLLQSKGCADCHKGRLAFEQRLRNLTLTGIAAAMWNHQGSMKQPSPNLSREEMRQILNSICEQPYFRGTGDAARPGKVFTEKGCAVCRNHPSSGAPALAKGVGDYSDITMVTVVWRHGPAMPERVKQRNLAGPRFTAQQWLI